MRRKCYWGAGFASYHASVGAVSSGDVGEPDSLEKIGKEKPTGF